jgi:hypothetical protein
MRQALAIMTVALTLAMSPMAMPQAQAADEPPTVVYGTLVKLDLESLKGLLTTDLGRPLFFEIPNPYLFENVTVGARITLQLDHQGRAVKVMDSSIADIVPAAMPADQAVRPPLATRLLDEGAVAPAPSEGRR